MRSTSKNTAKATSAKSRALTPQEQLEALQRENYILKKHIAWDETKIKELSASVDKYMGKADEYADKYQKVLEREDFCGRTWLKVNKIHHMPDLRLFMSLKFLN